MECDMNNGATKENKNFHVEGYKKSAPNSRKPMEEESVAGSNMFEV